MFFLEDATKVRIKEKSEKNILTGMVEREGRNREIFLNSLSLDMEWERD